MSEEQLREFFDAADKDDDGTISLQELVNILTKTFDGDRDKALTVANDILQADADSNRRISWDELVEAWKRQ